MLTAVAKRVIVKPIEEKTGALILSNQKPKKYMVFGIGDDVTKVAVNDTIFLEKHYGVELEHEGEKYSVIDESCILAKIAP